MRRHCLRQVLAAPAVCGAQRQYPPPPDVIAALPASLYWPQVCACMCPEVEEEEEREGIATRGWS